MIMLVHGNSTQNTMAEKNEKVITAESGECFSQKREREKKN